MIIKKVSIIIPTYNYKKFITASVDSVLSQSYEDIEIIVVDDGSTDSTKEILDIYGDKIIYIYQNNRGPSVARNTGLKHSSGDYVGFLDADDIFLHSKVEEQVTLLDNNENIGLVYSDYYCVDKNLKIMESYKCKGFKYKKETVKNLLEKNFINTSTVLIRREVLETNGYFNEEYKYLEDLDYWLRIAFDYDLGYLERYLVKTRSHGHNLRRQTSTRDKIRNGKEILTKYKNRLNAELK